MPLPKKLITVAAIACDGIYFQRLARSLLRFLLMMPKSSRLGPPLFTLICALTCSGCGGSSEPTSSSVAPDAGEAGSQSDSGVVTQTDSGVVTQTDSGEAGMPSDSAPPIGTPGSHVWGTSSVAVKLEHHWFYDTWGPDASPPAGGSKCWSYARESMSAAELLKLEELVLIPIKENCMSDGFSYYKLTVIDGQGGAMVFSDTGCSHRKVAGATAMLPQTFGGAFAGGTGVACDK